MAFSKNANAFPFVGALHTMLVVMDSYCWARKRLVIKLKEICVRRLH